ncbi:Hypothetical_protein [Hexamita inflata]|uniref:Hypothetical_protein n=1 Tax=Hexamita inflata TaxID=28002 RepID=A0ABP1GH60_9EUKA
MNHEAEFRKLLSAHEDRQAVRGFRFIFQKLVSQNSLSHENELILAQGIVNMIALSELGRNEKNYIPDVNAMINSIVFDSNVVNLLQQIIISINQEFWMTACDYLNKLDALLKDALFTQVKNKCSQFLESKYNKLNQAQQRKQGQALNAEKIVQEVKGLVDKQQKLI